ncbi:hypothetical protein ABZ135_38530 [Streptomyces sp. NPDC006339]|uniref:hypothetical protein n=1 Tax=Streptomyces sp. NPDC006339 TaxID=3156755 RepID=UPI0033A9C256
MTTSTETPAAGMTRLPAAGTKSLPDHGTLSRGKHFKCPCKPCRNAVNSYKRRVHRLQGYGTWQPLVDAEPARQHLLALNGAGFSYKVIAAHLGKVPSVVTGIVYQLSPTRGRKKRIRPEFAEAILAVTPEVLSPVFLPAVGTIRRLQALAAVGWPLLRLGPYIGVNPRSVSYILQQETVHRDTAKAVADCYQQLRTENPADHGITPGASTKAMRLAERRGWPDPVWWEDMGHIDDPAFDPAAAERPLNFHEQARLRAEEILHLASYGAGPDEIAERLGLGRDYVVARLRDLREVAA